MNELNRNTYGSKNVKDEYYKQKVSKLIKEIKYGSVTLVIQDGIVIQIESSQKIRLK
ncbi:MULTISPECIES: YezD family protein [Clostridium]|uniref:YezD family protein n=1 Tax=Clostridium TaxID=1485 RepID=UPI000824CDDC|nr:MULTISPECIES: YezD family protein [Clostridium]PJI07401.1 DUF2292 domain-containing protein [Clostridium sp. CT7]